MSVRNIQLCEEFNAYYPIGTRVTYRSLIGEESQHDVLDTKTRSEAWCLGEDGGEPVVLIEGKSGGVSVRHIEILAKPE